MAQAHHLRYFYIECTKKPSATSRNTIVRTKQPLTLFAWIILLGLSCFGLPAHAGDHACSDCHSSATPSASDLIRPLSGLCADCHRERIAAGEHAVDVLVTAPNNTLPLNKGEISCATCHDPHQPFAALRMEDPELCQQCHTR
jgi:predicted CXXCH cytochrome family protein